MAIATRITCRAISSTCSMATTSFLWTRPLQKIALLRFEGAARRRSGSYEAPRFVSALCV